MAAKYEGGDTTSESTLYVRIMHEGTNPARQRAAQIRHDLHANGSALATVETTVVPADAGQVAGLRAKTGQDADVWLVVTSTSDVDNASEVLLVPLSASGNPPEWVSGFRMQVEVHNVRTVGGEGDGAYRELRRRNVPCVLLSAVPWNVPISPSSIPRSRLGRPSNSGREAQAARAREVLAEYEGLNRAFVEDGQNLSGNIRDRLLDHFRERLAEVAGCTDVIIPPDLDAVIIDETTRRFVASALCVEQFACEYLDQETFDFALPGSGLWKAFERALNLSVVAALRREAGIIDSDPLLATGPNGKSREQVLAVSDVNGPHKTGDPRGVNLNCRQHDSKSELQGVSLGQIMWIIERAWDTAPPGTRKRYIPVQRTLSAYLSHAVDGSSLCSYVVGDVPGASPCSSELIEALKIVHRLRNPPSHISTMSETKYNDLREILLDNGHLAKVFRLVRVLAQLTAAFTGTGGSIDRGN